MIPIFLLCLDRCFVVVTVENSWVYSHVRAAAEDQKVVVAGSESVVMIRSHPSVKHSSSCSSSSLSSDSDHAVLRLSDKEKKEDDDVMLIDSAASSSSSSSSSSLSSSSSTLSSSHASSFSSPSDDEVESELSDQDSSSDQPRLLSDIRCSSCNGEDIERPRSDPLSRWLACEDDNCEIWFHAKCLGILPSRWQEMEDNDEQWFCDLHRHMHLPMRRSSKQLSDDSDMPPAKRVRSG